LRLLQNLEHYCTTAQFTEFNYKICFKREASRYDTNHSLKNFKKLQKQYQRLGQSELFESESFRDEILALELPLRKYPIANFNSTNDSVSIDRDKLVFNQYIFSNSLNFNNILYKGASIEDDLGTTYDC
jgi:hypothetical protein